MIICGFISKPLIEKEEEVIDNNCFLFNITKMKIYNIKENATAIFYNKKLGPCFGYGDNKYSLKVKNNYLTTGGSCVHKQNSVFLDYDEKFDINNNLIGFGIKNLEAYEVI